MGVGLAEDIIRDCTFRYDPTNLPVMQPEHGHDTTTAITAPTVRVRESIVRYERTYDYTDRDSPIKLPAMQPEHEHDTPTVITAPTVRVRESIVRHKRIYAYTDRDDTVNPPAPIDHPGVAAALDMTCIDHKFEDPIYGRFAPPQPTDPTSHPGAAAALVMTYIDPEFEDRIYGRFAPPQPTGGFTCTIQWPEYRCAMCGSCRTCDLKPCAQCERIRYCSETCRLQHHPHHRNYCARPPSSDSTVSLGMARHSPTPGDWETILRRLVNDDLLGKHHPDHIYLQTSDKLTLASHAIFTGRSDVFRLLVDAGAGDDAGVARSIVEELCDAMSASKISDAGMGIARRQECLWIWLHARGKLVSPTRMCILSILTNPLAWVCMWTELAGRAAGVMFDTNHALLALRDDRARFEAFRHLVRHGLPIDVPIPWPADCGETALSLAEKGQLPATATELTADHAYFVNHDAERLTLSAVAASLSDSLRPVLTALCISFLF